MIQLFMTQLYQRKDSEVVNWAQKQYNRTEKNNFTNRANECINFHASYHSSLTILIVNTVPYSTIFFTFSSIVMVDCTVIIQLHHLSVTESQQVDTDATVPFASNPLLLFTWCRDHYSFYCTGVGFV